MLVYRVFPHLPQAPSEAAGHPMHVYPQGSGRLDNPAHYKIWYLALEPAGAVAETFGDLDEWDSAMFEYSLIQGSCRALATYHLGDETPLLDLDDSRNLLSRGLRPTQVIERNRSATQNWALSVFNERNDSGIRIWKGVRWWSYYRPQWRIIGYWGSEPPELLGVDDLTLTSPAVIDAAISLRGSRKSAVFMAVDGVVLTSSAGEAGLNGGHPGASSRARRGLLPSGRFPARVAPRRRRLGRCRDGILLIRREVPGAITAGRSCYGASWEPSWEPTSPVTARRQATLGHSRRR
jgi:hypothetical protein